MLRATLTVLAFAMLAPVPQAVARAQEAPDLRIAVASMSPWIDAERPFELRLRVTNAGTQDIDALTVRVAAYARVTTRSALRAALDTGPTTGLVTAFERSTDGVAAGTSDSIAVREPLGTVLTGRGPYPLTITVSHAGGSVILPTVLPVFGPTDVGPLNVAWVQRVDAPIVPYPFGGFTPERLEVLDLDALTARLSALSQHDRARVTLAPSPALVELLGRLDADGVEIVRPAVDAIQRAAEAAGEIASVPYAAVDLPSLQQAARGEVLRQWTRGRSTIERFLGRSPSSAMIVPPGLNVDEASLRTAADLGATGTLLDGGLLARAPSQPGKLEAEKFGPLFPFTIAGTGMASALPDQPIAQRLAGGASGVLGAQAIIAETLGVWQELPLFAPERLVLIAPERLPGPTMLSHALDGLRSARWVRLRTMSQALAIPGAREAVELAPVTPVPPPSLQDVRAARRALATLVDITAEPIGDVDDLERAILLAAAEEWRDDPASGTSLARVVVDRLRSITQNLTVTRRRVTLTSRTGDAPLTIVNDTSAALRVRARIQGPKVRFPQGDSRVLELSPGDNTIALPVEVLGTGSFPVDVFVETPDGERRLATGRIVIRSTAVSTVSLAVVVGSGLFLLIAWRRQRRHRKAKAHD